MSRLGFVDGYKCAVLCQLRGGHCRYMRAGVFCKLPLDKGRNGVRDYMAGPDFGAYVDSGPGVDFRRGMDCRSGTYLGIGRKGILRGGMGLERRKFHTNIILY